MDAMHVGMRVRMEQSRSRRIRRDVGVKDKSIHCFGKEVLREKLWKQNMIS